MKVHNLRTWPVYFQMIKSGAKTFELRFNDRDFKRGDVLVLNEWDPVEGLHSGDSIKVEVTYILYSHEFSGLEKGYCIMAIKFE